MVIGFKYGSSSKSARSTGETVESPKNIISGLAESALEGWDEAGFSAITGSIARGDVDSVRKHVDSIGKKDENRAVYSEVGLKTIELCLDAGLIDEETSLKIKSILTRDKP